MKNEDHKLENRVTNLDSKTKISSADPTRNSDDVKNSRRSALHKLLAGSGAVLAGSQLDQTGWMKPTLNSIILPAHAQTSVAPSPSFSISGTVGSISGTVGSSQTSNLLDHFISAAYAQTENPLVGSCVSLEADDGNVEVMIALGSGQVLSGTSPFTGSSMSFSASGGGQTATVDVQFNSDSSPTSATGTAELDGFTESFTAEEGSNCVPTTTVAPGTTEEA